MAHRTAQEFGHGTGPVQMLTALLRMMAAGGRVSGQQRKRFFMLKASDCAEGAMRREDRGFGKERNKTAVGKMQTGRTARTLLGRGKIDFMNNCRHCLASIVGHQNWLATKLGMVGYGLVELLFSRYQLAVAGDAQTVLFVVMEDRDFVAYSKQGITADFAPIVISVIDRLRIVALRAFTFFTNFD